MKILPLSFIHMDKLFQELKPLLCQENELVNFIMQDIIRNCGIFWSSLCSSKYMCASVAKHLPALN